MKGPDNHQMVRVVALVPLVVGLFGCGDGVPVETVNVSLSSTETFEYPTVSGDEDGARIVTQAEYYSISEIRRGPETNWVATYVYRSEPGHVGTDYAEIEILATTFSGTPPYSAVTNIVKRLEFRFDIHE